MNLDIFKYLGSGAKMKAMLPLNLLSDKAKGDSPIRSSATPASVFALLSHFPRKTFFILPNRSDFI